VLVCHRSLAPQRTKNRCIVAGICLRVRVLKLVGAVQSSARSRHGLIGEAENPERPRKHRQTVRAINTPGVSQKPK
jgi:hypothetical protein